MAGGDLEGEGGWGAALVELAALARLVRCEQRQLFEDRALLGVFVSQREGAPFVWVVFEPDRAAEPFKFEMLWSVARELADHHFTAAGEALMRLDERVREGLAGAQPLSDKWLWEKSRELPGACELKELGMSRSRRLEAPQAMIDGALAWEKMSRAFESRSAEFLSALRAFDQEGLIQGEGRARLERELLEEQMPKKKASEEAGFKSKGAL